MMFANQWEKFKVFTNPWKGIEFTRKVNIMELEHMHHKLASYFISVMEKV